MMTTTTTDDYGATIRLRPEHGAVVVAINDSPEMRIDARASLSIEAVLRSSGTAEHHLVDASGATLRATSLLGPKWRTVLFSIEAPDGHAAVVVLDGDDLRLLTRLATARCRSRMMELASELAAEHEAEMAAEAAWLRHSERMDHEDAIHRLLA